MHEFCDFGDDGVPRVGPDSTFKGMTSVDDARGLAQSKLAAVLPRRWSHVVAVGAEASRIAQAFGDGAVTLIRAAWLHDIGYAPELAATGFHPLDGAQYLSQHGWPRSVCDLVAHHSCASREATLRGLAAELHDFVDEVTPVRDALWYCDLTTGPDGRRVTVNERLAEVQERYGPDHVVSRFVDEARPDLVGAVERTRALLVKMGLD